MSLATRRAIYGRMAGDSTLNALLGAPATGYNKAIYHNQAPAGAAWPFVVFFKSSGVPTYTMKTGAAFKSDVWTVKAVDRSTSADQAETIDSRLDALLTDGVISISGATQMYLRRESDVEYPETAEGVAYQHVGGLYRLVFEPT